ncbi:hypothetical protein FSP39_010681 [Pinctada imbricata]|uniref:DNA2/NAM7 helicase-like C-terminal domain-containing protein n=1 Tax=Pinctada imbricata TaxID=66713 RepID=A0AA88XTV3_PINIB|nr:hypothetical protein FSP39_010681 [Pinctada imbricata]
MRPEISMLMKHIYPDLVDHPSVRTYDHVKGVAKDVFLLTTSNLRRPNEETKSKSNLHEAKFMARFCRYLMQQGYNPSQITMLTTYTGQVLLLKKHMPRTDFEGIRITAVDNYQGEENDIILLSLVRSNKLNNIGFLKIENRICVALSRARMGFYIIGNFGLLAKESNLWENMVYTMVQRQCAGPKLTLCCQNHPMEETIVSKEEDFMAVPNGGCKRMCNSRLSCGHVCEQVCHPEDREHKFYRCFKPCEKIVCSAGHVCLKRCYADCGPCMTAVKKTIPSCSHEHPMPCSKDPTTVDCISPCDTLLDCGHVCKGKCGLCRKKSGHVPCDEKCIKTLSCGHHIESECSTTLENIKCTFKCTSKLTCGHESIASVRRNVEKYVTIVQNLANGSANTNNVKLKCSEKCNRPPCFTQCSKKLSCGCPCLGFCGEKCPQICPKCNKSEFEEITIHISDKPSVRLVALEECNDVFEASFFDEYMSSEETSSSTSFPVETKKCPKCSTLITKSNRYCGTLRAISNDINTVKKCMKVDAEESNRRKKRLISKIEALKEQDEDAANDLAKNPEIKKKNETASIETLDLLDNQINIILEVYDIFTIVKRRDIDSSVKRDVASLLMRIRNWVLREHFLPSKKAKLNTRWRRGFTQQEIEELINEFCRLRYIINISFMKKEKKANALGTYLTEAVEKLEHKFSSEEEIHLKRLIKVAVRFVPDLIPVIKLKLIVTKGVADNGKWYKCLNGHIGQVKEAIRACHECHLMVGPGSYTPRVHYPPDPVPVDSYIPFFTEKDVDATESLTKDSVSLGSSEHALPSEAGQLQGEIFDSQFTGVGIPVNGRSLEASNSFGTLQPGLIISSLQQAHEDTSEAGSSQCERSAQRNMKYVFKCSNVDSKGTSSRNIEQVDTDSVSLSRNSKDSRGKESSDTDRKKKEFSLVVRCNAGHILRPDQTDCRLCKYLVDINLTKISTSSSKSSDVAGELQASAYSTTQQSEGRQFQSKTSQPASEGTDGDKNSQSKSIPSSSGPSKPVTRKCHKGLFPLNLK